MNVAGPSQDVNAPLGGNEDTQCSVWGYTA